MVKILFVFNLTLIIYFLIKYRFEIDKVYWCNYLLAQNSMYVYYGTHKICVLTIEHYNNMVLK